MLRTVGVAEVSTSYDNRFVAVGFGTNVIEQERLNSILKKVPEPEGTAAETLELRLFEENEVLVFILGTDNSGIGFERSVVVKADSLGVGVRRDLFALDIDVLRDALQLAQALQALSFGVDKVGLELEAFGQSNHAFVRN